MITRGTIAASANAMQRADELLRHQAGTAGPP
jgi:hypothetical protein